MKLARKRLILLYHFFHPDDVISARLFTDLGEAANKNGWEVIAMPAVRSCHRETKLAKTECWHEIEIRRVWRPDWQQSSNKGRLGNTLFMLLGWTLRAIFTRSSGYQETVIVGTDPPLGVLAVIPWRIFRPRTRIIHWCHDLYPHAAIADGVVKPSGIFIKILNVILRFAYARCDYIVDLGRCMRLELGIASGISLSQKKNLEDENELPEKLDGATGGSQKTKFLTLTPWSLVEPEKVPVADHALRKELFGDAQLGLLYSGNLGRAHIYEPFVNLAQRLKSQSVAFCFAGRGPLLKKLTATLQESSEFSSDMAPIRLADFADEEVLQKRLAAADVHLVSLHPTWTGAVVPSKFFGALAVGRPVLFAGSQKCAIANWIRKFNVGWVIDETSNLDSIAAQMQHLVLNPSELAILKQRCFDIYHREFSKSKQLLNWRQVLG